MFASVSQKNDSSDILKNYGLLCGKQWDVGITVMLMRDFP